MRDELLSFEERVTQAGGFTFGARGDGHDDFVALLVTAAIADSERQLQQSPVRGARGVLGAIVAQQERERRNKLRSAAGLPPEAS